MREHGAYRVLEISRGKDLENRDGRLVWCPSRPDPRWLVALVCDAPGEAHRTTPQLIRQSAERWLATTAEAAGGEELGLDAVDLVAGLATLLNSTLKEANRKEGRNAFLSTLALALLVDREVYAVSIGDSPYARLQPLGDDYRYTITSENTLFSGNPFRREDRSIRGTPIGAGPRFIGRELIGEPRSEIKKYSLEPGEWFLLMSDGLEKSLPHRKLIDLLLEDDGSDRLADRIARSLPQSLTDDATLVAVQVGAGAPDTRPLTHDAGARLLDRRLSEQVEQLRAENRDYADERLGQLQQVLDRATRENRSRIVDVGKSLAEVQGTLAGLERRLNTLATEDQVQRLFEPLGAIRNSVQEIHSQVRSAGEAAAGRPAAAPDPGLRAMLEEVLQERSRAPRDRPPPGSGAPAAAPEEPPAEPAAPVAGSVETPAAADPTGGADAEGAVAETPELEPAADAEPVAAGASWWSRLGRLRKEHRRAVGWGGIAALVLAAAAYFFFFYESRPARDEAAPPAPRNVAVEATDASWSDFLQRHEVSEDELRHHNETIGDRLLEVGEGDEIVVNPVQLELKSSIGFALEDALEELRKKVAGDPVHTTALAGLTPEKESAESYRLVLPYLPPEVYPFTRQPVPAGGSLSSLMTSMYSDLETGYVLNLKDLPDPRTLRAGQKILAPPAKVSVKVLFLPLRSAAASPEEALRPLGANAGRIQALSARLYERFGWQKPAAGERREIVFGFRIEPVTYEAQTNDTFASIADRFGMSMEYLALLNPECCFVPYPGLEVTVPGEPER